MLSNHVPTSAASQSLKGDYLVSIAAITVIVFCGHCKLLISVHKGRSLSKLVVSTSETRNSCEDWRSSCTCEVVCCTWCLLIYKYFTGSGRYEWTQVGSHLVLWFVAQSQEGQQLIPDSMQLAYHFHPCIVQIPFFSVYSSNSFSLIPLLLFLPPSFSPSFNFPPRSCFASFIQISHQISVKAKSFSPGSPQTKYILDASAAHNTSIANTQCQCRMWCVLYIKVKRISQRVCRLQSMLAFSNHNHNLF